MSPLELSIHLVDRWLAGLAPLEEALERDNLLEVAEEEGTLGIVSAMLPADKDRRQRLASLWSRGVWQMRFLESLGKRLAALGLEVIALKGAALLPTVYGDDAMLRPMGDIDLMAHPQDLPQVREILEELEQQAALPVIDLHTRLLDTRRVPSRALLLPDEAGLWDRSRPWRPGIRHLAPEDQFLHLCLHAIKHSCCRLIWVVDLALALRLCRPERLPVHNPTLRLAVHLVRAFFPSVRLPFAPPPLSWLERLTLKVARRHRVGPVWGELFLALSMEGPVNKLVYLWEYLFLGEEIVTESGFWSRSRAVWKRLWRFLRNPRRNRGDST